MRKEEKNMSSRKRQNQNADYQKKREIRTVGGVKTRKLQYRKEENESQTQKENVNMRKEEKKTRTTETIKTKMPNTEKGENLQK